MGKLEATEVRLSQLKIDNGELRIDSEYYSKRNIELKSILVNYGISKIGDVATVTDGIHTSIDYDENSNVNLISATSPRENVFDLSRGAKISEVAHKLNPRTALRENDVIISTVGTIGNCAVADKSILPANSDRHVGIIRIKENYSPYVLSTFLLSKYGRFQTERETTGNVQPNLFIYKIRELLIPKFSDTFQNKIAEMVKSAHKKLGQSKFLYKQAEEILEKELGIDFESLTKKKSVEFSIVNSQSSIFSSGRLDAEYYQEKYDKIENAIKNYKGGYFTFGDNIKYIFTGEYSEEYCSKDSQKVFYIRSMNMKDGKVETDDFHYVNPKLFSKKVSTGDIITARVGTIGIFAEIDKQLDKTVCSDNIICFHLPDECIPSVYTMLLNSKPIFELVNRYARGSVQQRLNQETLKDLVLPRLSQSVQSAIAEKITESFRLREESKQLLEDAKLAVEREIEK